MLVDDLGMHQHVTIYVWISSFTLGDVMNNIFIQDFDSPSHAGAGISNTAQTHRQRRGSNCNNMSSQPPAATVNSIFQSNEFTDQPSSSGSKSFVNAFSIQPRSNVLQGGSLQNQGGGELPEWDWDSEDDDLAFLAKDFDVESLVHIPLIALNGVSDAKIRIQGIQTLLDVLLLANKSAMDGTFNSQMCAAALSEIGVPYLQKSTPFPSRDARIPSGRY